MFLSYLFSLNPPAGVAGLWSANLGPAAMRQPFVSSLLSHQTVPELSLEPGIRLESQSDSFLLNSTQVNPTVF